MGYIDLCVDVEKSDLGEAAKVAYELGYTALGVEDKGYSWKIKRINGITLYKRITITAEKEKELKEKLRGIKLKYPIVAVNPLGIQAARLAARDGRVDLVVLSTDSLDYIDKAQVSLMKQYGKPLELHVNSFLRMSGRARAMVYRRLNLFYRYLVPVVYSSGAKNWPQLIHPEGIVSLFSTLLELPRNSIRYSISSLPLEMVSKGR